MSAKILPGAGSRGAFAELPVMLLRLFLCLLLLTPALARAQTLPAAHTPDGKYSLAKIAVTMVYFVPKGRTPLPDWRARLEYFASRLTAFHAREFGEMSKLTVTVRPTPLRSPHTADEMRGGDQNAIFWRTMGEAWDLVGWPRAGTGEVWETIKRPDNVGGAFPILLILSDINWRELDDFKRERVADGKTIHEGYVDKNGRHFPGAESGGARATYLADKGVGVGLVSADGWRVPYSGSDCVVYHEGVGHSIGLPHPDPMNDSVMGTAQYHYWLNQTWIDPAQKQSLGLTETQAARQTHTDLFSTFTALPEPLTPTINTPVSLKLTLPLGAKVKTVTLETQTSLFGPWQKRKNHTFGKFPAATPVSYRVTVTLADGQTAQIWGYFQVKPSQEKQP